MPKNKKLKLEIIQLHYNILVAGYKGRQKMTELVIRNYWQPGVMKDIGKYRERYNLCQRIKNRTEVPVGKLMINKVLEKPYLMVNFITKLPLVVGKNAILIVCDQLSKIAYFVAIIEETSAEKLVQLFKDNIWKLYKLQDSAISDRGPQFAIELIKELNRMLEIKTRLSTAFHPQTDRQIKQMN